MEEILASIRKIISDDQAPPPPEPEPEPEKAAAKPEPAPPPKASAEDDDVLDLASIMVTHTAAKPEDTGDTLADDLDFLPEAPPPEPAPAIMMPPPPPPSEVAPPPVEALLSHGPNAAVSHAFGSLSHMILSQNARTLDDLVKDMLRPMLKSWLDDNLPSLVERLVKAEIERVARGGR